MCSSFLILWSSARVKSARQAQIGIRLPFLFGGPHSSEPSLSRYKIGNGDRIYPIGVSDGAITVMCELTIGEVISADQFVARYHLPASSNPTDAIHKWLAPQRLSFLAPTCTEDAAIVQQATPLRFESIYPSAELDKIRFVNSKGERPINHVENGRLKSAVGLQGHFLRLSEATAKRFESLVQRD